MSKEDLPDWKPVSFLTGYISIRLMPLAVRMVPSSKAKVRPTGRLAAAIQVFPLRG